MNKFFYRGVPLEEKMLFCRHLAITLRSGMTFIDSLRLIRRQPHSSKFKNILDKLLEDVTRGVFLSKSLEKFTPIFGVLFINIIKIAETSGTLPENLEYLAEELKKSQELRSRVKSALIYPLIILILTFIIATTLIIFVFPKLLPLFQSLDVDLPITTRILIAVAEFLSSYGVWVLVGLAVFIAALRILNTVRGFRYFFHRGLISVPIFGRIVVETNLVMITRTLALLLQSGVKIVEAINITAESLKNLVYIEELKAAAEKVKKGEFMSKHLGKNTRFFPQIFSSLIEVGENTGNLTENLKYLTEYYDRQVNEFVKNLAGILEPILLIFMGALVGFIALSFITPLYKITQGIH